MDLALQRVLRPGHAIRSGRVDDGPRFLDPDHQGLEEADLQGEGAKTWFGAMVDKQVNMGTTLDLLWLAKFGTQAALKDPDRRYIPPMPWDAAGHGLPYWRATRQGHSPRHL